MRDPARGGAEPGFLAGDSRSAMIGNGPNP